jgi:Carboxypeptidase regulatory-like domain
MTKTSLALGAALAFSLALACASKAPGPTGTVSGVAVDRSGHGLPGITVTIQTDSGKVVDTVVTASDGSYLFPSVPPGRYQVLTLLSGFTTPSPLGAFVTSGQSTTLPPLLILAPGLGSSSIELVTPTPTP